MNKNIRLYLVLLAAFIAQLFFVFKEHPVWWDSSIYLGMGHYIYSLGQIGIWEPIRPLVWPLILGFFWKIGLNDVFIGYLLGIGFSLGSIALAYLICKKLYNEEAGLIAALMLAFTPVFFESFFRNLTELPSVFFALLAVYLFIAKKPFLAGAFAGISFLTKFPNGILIAALVLAALLGFKIKDSGKTAAGSIIIVLPYLIFNYFMYGSALNVFIEADYVVKNAGTWLFSGPWHYYIVGLLKQNPLYVLAVIGAYSLIREKKYLVPVIGFLFIAYFSIHIHKEMRFAVLMLPYMAVIAGFGIKRLFKQKWIFWPAAGIALLVFFTHLPSELPLPAERISYIHYLEDKSIKGEVLVSDPLAALHSPKAAIPMYYPVYNAGLAEKWIGYVKQNKEKISYVLFDTCEGGIVCAPSNEECKKKTAELLELLKKEFSTAYKAERAGCKYYAFSAISPSQEG